MITAAPASPPGRHLCTTAGPDPKGSREPLPHRRTTVGGISRVATPAPQATRGWGSRTERIQVGGIHSEANSEERRAVWSL